MSDVRSRHAACLIAAVVSAITAQVFPSHAARPLITDDARIVDPKSCQVEAWRRRNEDTTEYWALPGCNPTGNAEITVGGAFVREAGALHTSDVQAQVKTLFRTLEPNGWAIGLVLGYLDHKADGHRDVLGRFYSYVPASFSFANDAFVLHTNVGTLRASDESRHRLTWGVGSETRITPNLFLVAEAFKLERDGPHYQAGIRFWIVPNRVQVDATIGDRIGHSNGSRWYSIGLRLLSPPFLP
jgi:hypothetical protein